MSFSVSLATITTAEGNRTGVVLTPTSHMSIDRRRYQSMCENASPSALDITIREAVLQHRGVAAFTILRGTSPDGRGSWRIADEFTTRELHDLGYRLTQAQLVNYRIFAAAGICVHARTDWQDAAIEAFAEGSERLVHEIRRRTSTLHRSSTVDRLDLWCLEHLTFTFSLSCERLLTEILPGRFTLLERPLERVISLARTLPAELVDPQTRRDFA